MKLRNLEAFFEFPLYEMRSLSGVALIQYRENYD